MYSTIHIPAFRTRNRKTYKGIPLSYQVFGPALGTAPVVLVNHALTGNSDVSGAHGWWKQLIGPEQCIDTHRFTVLAFNVPGNGYDGYYIESYGDFSVYDVARLFLEGLQQLHIDSLYAVIGGSLGGSVAWQMAVLAPELATHIIPVASDWKATDWLLGQCRVQHTILENSRRPVYDARIHAMTFYRTPQSFRYKFNRSVHEDMGIFNVESWLLHHGEALEKRFDLSAYKLMNHLLMTNDITYAGKKLTDVIVPVQGNIHLVGINSDGFYLNSEICETHAEIKQVKDNVYYHEIDSVHGHDAFLIEYDQLNQILTPVFNPEPIRKHKNERKNNFKYQTIS